MMERTGKNLDAAGRALLEEDLRSPCTEEVAVFHAFSHIVSGAKREIVVMDTARLTHLIAVGCNRCHREALAQQGWRER
ncbi:MAG: hypothetical protein U0X75_07030 [Acidobacteriota bacterium]